MESKINQLENELRTIRQELQSSKNENSTLKNEKQTLKNENSTLKNENGTLKNEKQALKNENGTLKNEKQALKNENQTLKTLSTSLNSDKLLYQANCEKIQQELIREKNKRCDRCSEYQSRCATLEREKMDIRNARFTCQCGRRY
jgi:chromosome segregation ATPase